MNIFKLGKHKPKLDPRTLPFSKYRLAPVVPLPPIPSEVSWVAKLSNLGMMLNDELGCCTISAAGHMIQQWTTYAGKTVIVPDSAILKGYEDVGRYIPGDPSTDNGCNMLDVLKYWKNTGIGGHKIAAFMSIDITNKEELQAATYLFGNIYTGVALPLSAQGGDSWTVTKGGVNSDNGQPGGWGGHCIPCCARSPKSRTVITWGSLLKESPNFEADYMDEAYAVLSADWVNQQTNLSPVNFNFNQLMADLAQV